MNSASPIDSQFQPPALHEALDGLRAGQADSCRRLTARVLEIKQALVARYRAQEVPAGLIREAIAAAEAQAWLSGFPHLFLPGLADEILEHLRRKRSSIHPEYAQAA